MDLVPAVRTGSRTLGQMSALFVALKVAHIVAAVIGFGPLFVYPLMISKGDPQTIMAMKRARRIISEPAFLSVGPLGVLAATQHPDEEIFSRLWVHLAIPLWLIAASVVLFIQRPLAARVAVTARALADGDASKASELRSLLRWLTRVTWVSWAGLVGMLVLMVTKPA
jgi:Predicted integral membrane protein (DUF2269)